MQTPEQCVVDKNTHSAAGRFIRHRITRINPDAIREIGCLITWGMANTRLELLPWQKNWSLQLRSLAPILSASSLPLPGIECRPVGAARYRVFLPITPGGFEPPGPDFLVQRTNLLSPSVAHLPVFKVTLVTATNSYNAKAQRDCQQKFSGFWNRVESRSSAG